MSFGNTFKNLGIIQEALIIALLITTVFAIFYFNFSLTLKITIAIVSFTITILVSTAGQLFTIQKETTKTQH
ncbi:MAG: hypothetical protein FWH37_03885 [Candidatus Bathyarchaeota archaeon]|nr:hypothetical protein [Candidatus Termiticorpusculum sp.]